MAEDQITSVPADKGEQSPDAETESRTLSEDGSEGECQETPDSWPVGYWPYLCELRIAAATADLAEKLYFNRPNSKPHSEVDREKAVGEYNKNAHNAFGDYENNPVPIKNWAGLADVCEEAISCLKDVARFRDELPKYPDVRWTLDPKIAELLCYSDQGNPLVNRLNYIEAVTMKWLDCAKDFTPRGLLRELLNIAFHLPDGKSLSAEMEPSDDLDEAIKVLRTLSSHRPTEDVEAPLPDNPAIRDVGEKDDGKADSNRKLPLKEKVRKPKANELMITTMLEHPEAEGWTCRQFSRHIKRSISTVVGTLVWKSLKLNREKAKAERRKDRHRKPKQSELKRG